MPTLTGEPDLARLIKLLKMTSSSHDGEALTAIRMANAALDRVGGDWDTLLRGKVTIITDPWAHSPAPAPSPPRPQSTWTPPRQAAQAPPPRPQPAAPPPPPKPAPPIWPHQPIYTPKMARGKKATYRDIPIARASDL